MLGLYAREHCLVCGREHLKACPRKKKKRLAETADGRAGTDLLTATSQYKLLGLLGLGKNPRGEFGIDAFIHGHPFPTREWSEGCILLWRSGT